MIFDPSKVVVHNGDEISKLTFPEDHCIIQPRILPLGGKLIFGGYTKVGKTFVALSLIRGLITGGYAWDNPEWKCKRAKTLFVEKEIGPWGIGERIKPAFEGVDEETMRDYFKVLTMPKGFSLSDDTCITWLKKYCEGEGIEAIVYDPMNMLHGWNENDSTDILKLIEVLDWITEERMVTIYSHHYKKPPRGKDVDGADPLDVYNYSGSARFVNDADAILTLNRLPGRLSKDHESWRLDARLTLRHGPSPEDFQLNVNEFANCRVEFKSLAQKEKKVKEQRDIAAVSDFRLNDDEGTHTEQ